MHERTQCIASKLHCLMGRAAVPEAETSEPRALSSALWIQ